MMSKINHTHLKTLLSEKSISIKALVRRLNKTESTISRWSINDFQPSNEAFYQIVNHGDVGIRNLFVSTFEK